VEALLRFVVGVPLGFVAMAAIFGGKPQQNLPQWFTVSQIVVYHLKEAGFRHFILFSLSRW